MTRKLTIVSFGLLTTFLVLAFGFQFLSKKTVAYENEIPRIQLLVQSKTQFLDNECLNIVKQIEQEDRELWAVFDSIAIQKHYGNSFFFFNDSGLAAWSDTSVPVGDNVTVFSKRIIQFANGWYYVVKHPLNNGILVGLFHLKMEYHYENQFLKNHFNSDLGIDEGVDIALSDDDSLLKINDSDGQYLFSLTLNGEQSQGKVWAILSVVLFVLCGVILFFIVYKIFKYLSQFPLASLYSSIIFIVLLILFAGLVKGNLPSVFYNFKLFSPDYFAASEYLPSLGVLLGLALIIFFFSVLFYRYFKEPQFIYMLSAHVNRLFSVVVLLFLFGGIWWFGIHYLIRVLVENSSDASIFFKIIDIDLVAIIKIAIISLLLLSFVLIIERIVLAIYLKIERMPMLVALWFSVFILGVLNGIFHWQIPLGILLFFGSIVTLLIIVKRTKQATHGYGTFVWFVFLFSLYTVVNLYHLEIKRELANRSIMLENLAFKLVREEDPVAEMYLAQIEKRMRKDMRIKRFLMSEVDAGTELIEYLKSNYFYGYWGRYEMQTVTCWPQSDLIIEESGERYDCYNYFSDIIKGDGSALAECDGFYFVDNDNGRVTYLGKFIYFENTPNETTVFIELNSKPFFEGLGYPELLLSQQDYQEMILLKEYSYAKYVDGKLVKRSGEFVYPVNEDYFHKNDAKRFESISDHFSHLIYQSSDNEQIVLSRPVVDIWQQMVGFSIVFVSFFLVSSLLLIVFKINKGRPFLRFSIQERIQMTLIAIVFLLLVVVAGGSIYHSMFRFKQKNNELLRQKIKSVLTELETTLSYENSLTIKDKGYLNGFLQKLSNVFYSDINVYDLSGHLIASSREELFNKGLVGSYMNPQAYFTLKHEVKSEFIHQEEIGTLDFVSAYVPLVNSNNMVMAYLNLPYFIGNSELREEVSGLVVAIVNFYLIFMLFVIFLAIVVSKRITHPLLIIQERMGQVRLGETNNPIAYAADDEIGSLVREYNSMLSELSQSAEKLARSERESAWREMAKQIAHEIKNPLTPMKLSVQHLLRAWTDQKSNFGDYLERVSATLTEQIDTLSSIATEFSNFAKMPTAKRQQVNVVERVINCVELHKKHEDTQVSLELNGMKNIPVFMDPEQLTGLLNNLVKNAIQSIESGKQGHVKVELLRKEEDIILSVTDNGRGITDEVAEKLFVPNFTTKSSGMGLGLAIVKKIVNDSDGEIWFQSEVGEGSVFYVRFPIMD